MAQKKGLKEKDLINVGIHAAVALILAKRYCPALTYMALYGPSAAALTRSHGETVRRTNTWFVDVVTMYGEVVKLFLLNGVEMKFVQAFFRMTEGG